MIQSPLKYFASSSKSNKKIFFFLNRLLKQLVIFCLFFSDKFIRTIFTSWKFGFTIFTTTLLVSLLQYDNFTFSNSIKHSKKIDPTHYRIRGLKNSSETLLNIKFEINLMPLIFPSSIIPINLKLSRSKCLTHYDRLRVGKYVSFHWIGWVIRWAHQVVCAIRRVIIMDGAWEHTNLLSTRMTWTVVEDAHEGEKLSFLPSPESHDSSLANIYQLQLPLLKISLPKSKARTLYIIWLFPETLELLCCYQIVTLHHLNFRYATNRSSQNPNSLK